MKLKFTIYDLRFTIWKKSASSVAINRQSGIALVLTLILLSVTLIMAVAFLFISRREQGSVTTQTDAATARYAADSALAKAQAQIVANILAGAQPNPYNYGLLVSTNFINPNGWAPGLTNVNYDFVNALGTPPLNTVQFLENLTNLFYDPRPPVYFPSTTNANVYSDFRFYLDLNRNGSYDTNGWVTNLDSNLNGFGTTNFEVGDPEWIGVLERPDEPYGPNNHFVARYAYIAIPIGNTLDLNAIHNQVFDEKAAPNGLGQIPVNPAPNGDAYFRNQGVGSWEMNLAAFLADLNTNQWGEIIDPPNILGGGSGFYTYQEPSGNPNHGIAFDDARALLAYRYANDYNTLAQGNALFFNTQNYPFNVDVYADGGLQTTVDTNYFPFQPDNLSVPFAGADNTNHFFDLPSDLFDRTKTATGVSAANVAAGRDFTSRLENAGTNGSTYDRYTFYRMLSQLGTDSEPESGKMNLNYDNLDVSGNVIAGAETNFIPWTNSIKFFTNAADRLLRAYTAQWAADYFTNDLGIVTNTADYGSANTNFIALFNGTNGAPFYVTNSFGVGNIPVYVNGRFVYTPAVNRLLQLAANIYDATQTNFYPHIFRPIFSCDFNTNVFITGYTNLTRTDFAQSMETLDPDLATPIEVWNLPTGQSGMVTNVYGVPWIIGAKKGFPNFNEFATESTFQITRKLDFIRDTNTTPQPDILLTNQMFQMNFSNSYGIEFWNSYRSNYPNPVDIFTRCTSFMVLAVATNDTIFYPLSGGYTNGYSFTNLLPIFPATTPASQWQGWSGVIGQQTPGSSSFVVPLYTNVAWFSNAMTFYYNEPNPPNDAYFTSDTNYPDAGLRELPHFVLLTTNRLQGAVIDFSAGPNNGRIIDYVQLGGMDSSRDLNAEILANDKYGFFSPTFTNGIMEGVYQQIHMSMYGSLSGGGGPVGPEGWTAAQIPGGPSNPGDQLAQQAFFSAFFSKDGNYTFGEKFYNNAETNMQAPYTPTVIGVQSLSWQANDPLVHYLTSDLTSLAQGSGLQQTFIPLSFTNVNGRYMPWGRHLSDTGVDQNPYDLSFKDPLVWQSDDWDFTTNVLPTVGWLGRVHRGTPWQSVYLKSTNILDLVITNGNGTVLVDGLTTWLHWTGNGNLFDATNMAPAEDRLLFDLFTTQFDDNATRGRLSVNVAPNSFAAWSAVFSGMVALSNNLSDLAIRGGGTRYQHPLPTKSPPSFTNLVINPMGPDMTNSMFWHIVTNIDGMRRTFINHDGLIGAFEHKSDIMSAALLSDQSPFLNRSVNQITNGISDEMYEWLPQQAMSLLSGGDQPTRYVIYSWGQSLQPAPGGVYLGSDYFGMVTNYQVTAETATRAVVRVTPTNAVIESFNILPPD